MARGGGPPARWSDRLPCAVRARADLRAGETLLILGAGSGLSIIALNLARSAGARVIMTSSSDEKLSRAAELGASSGYNYADGDWASEVLAATGGVDVVLDSVGGTWPDSTRATRPGGRIVSCGATTSDRVAVDVRPFYLEQRTLLGTKMGSPRDFAELVKAVALNRIRPTIDSVHRLEDGSIAHARMESGGHFGKLVLAVDD